MGLNYEVLGMKKVSTRVPTFLQIKQNPNSDKSTRKVLFDFFFSKFLKVLIGLSLDESIGIVPLNFFYFEQDFFRIKVPAKSNLIFFLEKINKKGTFLVVLPKQLFRSCKYFAKRLELF